jgi:hypothetical protein
MKTIIKEELITPQKAEILLKKNTNNRRLNSKTISNYAKEMASGKWKRNTFEVIKVSKNGRIIDGQHRLSAVILSKQPTFFHVAYNVNDDIFDVLDTGKKRNANDVFHISGIKNSNTTPSIIKFFISLMDKRISERSVINSNNELLETYNQNPEFWDNISTDTHKYYVRFSKILAPAYIGGLLAYFSEKKSYEIATSFFEDLTNGNSERTTAISLIRKKLIDDKMSKQTRMPEAIKRALLIKTFLLWLDRKDTKILKYDIERESFPFIN